jgi:uncharacterized membrane protein YkvA (DUF1232 family)
MLDALRSAAHRLRREATTLYLIARDPRTPLLARLLAGAVAAYALSPIDLIPDAIPVLGLLDDLVIVPLGVALVLRLVPDTVQADARARAAVLVRKPVSRAAAVVVVLIWIALALAAALLLWPLVQR